ncbi:MAG: dihydrofolate reductase [Marinicella sp.]
MSLTLIAAMDKNGLIGKNNQLPWHLPVDLKFFKKQTLGKKVLMGRKTCESLPFPLPNRENIVLSRNLDFTKKGFTIINKLDGELLQQEIMVIGGSTIYELLMPQASAMILTRIDYEFDGDTYFPAIDWHIWNNIRTTYIPISESNKDYPLAFEFYERKG